MNVAPSLLSYNGRRWRRKKSAKHGHIWVSYYPKKKGPQA